MHNLRISCKYCKGAGIQIFNGLRIKCPCCNGKGYRTPKVKWPVPFKR